MSYLIFHNGSLSCFCNNCYQKCPFLNICPEDETDEGRGHQQLRLRLSNILLMLVNVGQQLLKCNFMTTVFINLLNPTNVQMRTKTILSSLACIRPILCYLFFMKCTACFCRKVSTKIRTAQGYFTLLLSTQYSNNFHVRR